MGFSGEDSLKENTIMIQKTVKIIFLLCLFIVGISGQTFSKEYWKEIARNSDVVVIGVVEKRLKLIRPEKYKPNPDGSTPSEREFTVGEFFQVRVTKKLRGKILVEKEEDKKHLFIFDAGGNGLHDVGLS